MKYWVIRESGIHWSLSKIQKWDEKTSFIFFFQDPVFFIFYLLEIVRYRWFHETLLSIFLHGEKTSKREIQNPTDSIEKDLNLWSWNYIDEPQVQRQLQLRIEAQGKYLKKIIEEQQRISGALPEVPGSGVTARATEDTCRESDNKSHPATPAPTSESPHLDRSAKERAIVKSLSLDESFSYHQEPLTPDSGCHVNSSIDSPRDRPGKKQRSSTDAASSKQEMALSHSIFNSSLSPSFQQPHSVFLSGEQFDHSSGMSVANELLGKVSGGNI